MSEITDSAGLDIPLSKVWEIYQILKNRLAKDVGNSSPDIGEVGALMGANIGHKIACGKFEEV